MGMVPEQKLKKIYDSAHEASPVSLSHCNHTSKPFSAWCVVQDWPVVLLFLFFAVLRTENTIENDGEARLRWFCEVWVKQSPRGQDGPYKENPFHALLRDHKIFLVFIQGPSPLAGDPSRMWKRIWRFQVGHPASFFVSKIHKLVIFLWKTKFLVFCLL